VDISFITGELAIGGANIFPDGARHHQLDVDDLKRLKDLGITHLLSVREYGEQNFMTNFLWLPTDNILGSISAEWMRKVIEYHQEAEKLYLYCNEGLDRSPSAAYGILRSEGHPKEYAENIVRRARPQVRMPYIPAVEAALLELKEAS
jgi:hypothetical protein